MQICASTYRPELRRITSTVGRIAARVGFTASYDDDRHGGGCDHGGRGNRCYIPSSAPAVLAIGYGGAESPGIGGLADWIAQASTGSGCSAWGSTGGQPCPVVSLNNIPTFVTSIDLRLAPSLIDDAERA